MRSQFVLAIAVAAVSLPVGYFLGKHMAIPAGAGSPNAASHGPVSSPVQSKSAGTSVAGSGQQFTPPDPGDFLAGLSREEIKQRTTAALCTSDRLLRWKAWLEIVAAVNADNVDAVSEALVDRYKAGADTGWEGGVLQHREGQVLGALAMDKLPAEPNGEVAWHQRNKMRGWATASPQEAKAWLDKLEPGAVQNTLRSEWLQGLADAPPASIAAIFPFLDPKQQRPLIDGIIRGLHDQQGLAGVRTWFEETGKNLDPGVASEALTKITSRLTNNTAAARADEAAAMLRSQASEPWMTPAVFDAFSTKVAGHNPGKALTLLSDLADKSPAIQASMDSLIARTIETSTSGSLNELGTWLNANPGHPIYDRAVSQFALRTKADDLESALRWAATIHDESLRQATEQSLQSAP